MLKWINISFLIIWILGTPAVLISQNTQPASPVLSRPQQKKPDSKEELALKYYREKEYKKASELFEQIYNSNQSNYIYSYLFNCYVQTNDYDKAAKIAHQQSRKHKINYRYVIDEAYVTDLSGNKRKASRILDKLLNELPDQRNQILQITNSLIAKGYSELAVEIYLKANANNMNTASYGFELANAYMYSGDYSLMFDSYLEHLELVPTEAQRVKSKLQMVMRMDVNDNLTEMLKAKLLRKSQANPDDTVMAEMLLWFSLQTKDFEMAFRQARSLDIRFKDGDKNMIELANVAYSNSDFATAEKAFEYVKEKGKTSMYYTDAYVGYYLSKCIGTDEDPAAQRSDYEELEKDGIKAIDQLGINNKTTDIILRLANLSAFKLEKYNDAQTMIEKALAFPAISKIKESELKIALADIMLAKGKIWDATLLYSQVEQVMKNEPIGHEAKLKNAKVFYYVGEFDWAATKLDVLKSATSKFISNDAIELSLFIKEMRDEDTLGFILRKFAGADMYAYQKKYDSALIFLNKIEDEPFGYVSKEYALYRKAQILSHLNKLDESDATYEKLILQYPKSIKTDNAYYERAEVLLRMGNEQKAKDLYLKLMTQFPESIYAGKARKRYRSMEDKTNGLDN